MSIDSNISEPVRRRRYTIKDQSILSERRASLVEVATRVFAERGYANCSVNDVAAEADISIGSLYKYVQSKEELLHLVMDSVSFEMAAGIAKCAEVVVGGSCADALRSVIRQFLLIAEHVRPGIRMMYREFDNLSKEHQREVVARNSNNLDLIEQIVVRGNASGEFACRSPRVVAMNILVMEHWVTLERWALGDISIEDYIERQCELILDGVRANGTSRRRRSTASANGSDSATYATEAQEPGG